MTITTVYFSLSSTGSPDKEDHPVIPLCSRRPHVCDDYLSVTSQWAYYFCAHVGFNQWPAQCVTDCSVSWSSEHVRVLDQAWLGTKRQSHVREGLGKIGAITGDFVRCEEKKMIGRFCLDFNPLYAYAVGLWHILVHFLSFHVTEMVQLVEILPHEIKGTFFFSTQSGCRMLN